ncbi:MAG: hypothetical protein Kow0025_00440 [Thermodesulfovibrionales bacterium]
MRSADRRAATGPIMNRDRRMSPLHIFNHHKGIQFNCKKDVLTGNPEPPRTPGRGAILRAKGAGHNHNWHNPANAPA